MITIDMAATGQNIRKMRLTAGMTVRELTAACGVSAAAVTKWQSGRTLPAIDNLVVLAALWKVRIDDIIVVRADRKAG